MPTPFLIQNDHAFKALGALYVKEVLREGKYQHPVSPWAEPLDATPEYMNAVAERSNRGLEAKVEVPIPDGHDDRAKDNAGWVKSFFVAENDAGTQSLFVRADITDPAYKAKIDDGSISKVSVFLAPFGDGQFDPGGDRVVHVALTSYPVASPQGGFVALSLGGKPSDVPVLKMIQESKPMKFSLTVARAKVLGLTLADTKAADDAQMEVDAELVVAAAEKALSLVADANKRAADAQAAVLAANAAAAAAQVDIVKTLSVDPTKERFFARSKVAFDAAVKSEVDALVKSGRLTLDVAADVTAILSTEKAYTLSLDGKAAESDVPALLRKVLAVLPEGAVVPVGERVTKPGTAVETPVVTGKGLSAEEIKATSDRMAAHANNGIKT